MRDLGLMGESTFNLWCADAGLIPNGSAIDKTGWDFFVEFQFNDLLVHKIHESAKECKIQVKATDKKERKLQFPLSNLRRLVTTPLPTFILFIEFNNKSHAENAFLVHIDNDLSTQILRRIYELRTIDHNVRLNKKTMTIHYSERHKLITPDGHHLKDTLIKHIGENFEEYIKNKEKHIASTGYENGCVRINFSTNGKDNLEKMIDSSLGMNVKFSVSGLTHNNMRFGIIDSSSRYLSENAIMQFEDVKPFSPCKLVISTDKFSIPTVFDCNLYVSTIHDALPNQYRKIRVENESFDLLFKPHTGEANYTFHLDRLENISLIQAKKTLTTYKLIKSHGKSVPLNIKLENGKVIDFAVNCRCDSFDLTKELKAAEQLIEITKIFKFDNEISISLRDLHYLSEDIDFILSSLTRELPSNLIKVEFTINNDNLLQNKVAVLFLVYLPVGEYCFCTIISFIGTPKNMHENHFELNVTDYDICKKFVQTAIEYNEINKLLIEIANSYDDSYSVIIDHVEERS